MADYQQLRDHQTGGISGTVLRRSDGAYIPDDPANRDRQMYMQWLEAGNEPDPPDAPPQTATLTDVVDVNELAKRVEALERHIKPGREA